MIKIRKSHWLGAIFAILIILIDVVFFRGDNIFFFLIGIGFSVFLLPILVSLVVEGRREQEINQQFLEFSRNLAEGVKAGTPIGKSIINMQNKDFGPLTKHINKLANQISIGIPISQALDNFSSDVKTEVIRRAVTLIREAEGAGGEIENILDSVANSIYQVEKLKRERRNAISGLVVQGYIIFFVFLGIMLVMEFKILPLTVGITSIGDISSEVSPGLGGGNVGLTVEALARPFLYLLLVQGFFTGLTVGKLSEGSVKAGIKHSMILCIIAFLVFSGARIFL